jgi:hypothetical protein
MLGKGPINTHYWQQKKVFSVGSVSENYKRAQLGQLKEYNGVQRNSSVQFSSVGRQNSSRGVSSRKMTVCQWFVNCCNQLYKEFNKLDHQIPPIKKLVLLVTQTPDTWQYLPPASLYWYDWDATVRQRQIDRQTDRQREKCVEFKLNFRRCILSNMIATYQRIIFAVKGNDLPVLN